MWGFGKADRWNLNQADGNLIFTFPDKTVTCEAQIIGSLDKSKGTWLWAWDNPGVATNLTRASQQLRDYGKQHRFSKLTRAEWKGSADEAREMVALATLVCEAGSHILQAETEVEPIECEPRTGILDLQ